MGRKALYRSSDGLLLEHGFVDFQPLVNQFVRDVADDFALSPLLWKWTGNDHEAVPPAPPPDYANLDNLDKTFKAIGLLMRDYCNQLKTGTYAGSGPDGVKTIAEVKADFTAKYNSL